MKGVDIETAVILLRQQLRLPERTVSVSVAEANGDEAIVVSVEQAKNLWGVRVPKSFEGYPVFVEIRSIGVH